MSTPTPSVAVAPFEVFSVHFDFPNGGDAIKLKDPETDQFLGDTPEWVTATRNDLAAYVRGTRPHVRVVFRGPPGTKGTSTVVADGVLLQIEEREVSLAFDPVSGRSAPEVFRARGPLPDRIGVHAVGLDWYIQRGAAAPHLPLGTTTHRICTSWRAMKPNRPQELEGWVYRPLMEWTCEWAAGQDDEKDICDAIIRNVGTSGLHYGMTKVIVRTVRELLVEREAMCGVWYKAFQQMAHCQGVFVHRRMFCVDCRPMASGEQHWCAIVICSGGLNRTHPTHLASEFHDNDSGVFPLPAAVALTNRVERRYRFWGWPNRILDGHCVNFLEHGGRLYLYDACFGIGPIEIDMPLPPPNPAVVHGGAQLASLKARYLDGAINYMLGSLLHGGMLLRSVWFFPPLRTVQNGVTVRTRDIPQVVNGNHGLTFRWVG